jgi:hypothetical protein
VSLLMACPSFLRYRDTWIDIEEFLECPPDRSPGRRLRAMSLKIYRSQRIST